MTFSAVRRAPGFSLRGAAFRVRPQATAFRTSMRWNTTGTSVPPPKSGSNSTLYGIIGITALAGAGYWVYTSQDDASRGARSTLKEGTQIAKSLANYVPTKEDYQKVYNKIADVLDTDQYDGELEGSVLSGR